MTVFRLLFPWCLCGPTLSFVIHQRLTLHHMLLLHAYQIWILCDDALAAGLPDLRWFHVDKTEAILKILHDQANVQMLQGAGAYV